MSVRDLIPWGRGGRAGAVPAPRTHDPFLALHREVDRLFDDFWRDATLPGFGAFGGAGWPTVDVAETDTDVRVTAELPGIDDRDLEILLETDSLTLKGEKKTEFANDDAVHLTERFYGAFERTIPLPAEIDRDRAEASFKNGVLTVTLPKTARARERAKRIPITH